MNFIYLIYSVYVSSVVVYTLFFTFAHARLQSKNNIDVYNLKF